MTVQSEVASAESIERFLDVLRCPHSGVRLIVDGSELVGIDGKNRYAIDFAGVPIFAERGLSAAALAQQAHYDRIASAYTANLGYPHTQEYMAYLDREMLAAAGQGSLGTLVELCCGSGEALPLFGPQVQRYVGVDVSQNMLKSAVSAHRHGDALFVQADATCVPLATGCVDTVVMLGGIHHVSARERLFAEVSRILKPGGRFLFREPVSDFFLWRVLRAMIYRWSPMLDHATERPLRYEETVPVLVQAGFQAIEYRTHGFLGFCFFMNSDVLFFNRVFRFVPGIRAITRLSARVDRAILSTPGFERAGLQVIGVARK